MGYNSNKRKVLIQAQFRIERAWYLHDVFNEHYPFLIPIIPLYILRPHEATLYLVY